MGNKIRYTKPGMARALVIIGLALISLSLVFTMSCSSSKPATTTPPATTPPPSVTTTQSATVAVNPGGAIAIAQGGSGSVSITISGTGFPPGDGIGAFDVTINWDQNVINVESVSSSWIFPPPLFDLTSPVVIAGLSVTPLASVSVALLSITAVGSPGDSTTISVSVKVLIDNNSYPIPYTTSDTVVQIIQ